MRRTFVDLLSLEGLLSHDDVNTNKNIQNRQTGRWGSGPKRPKTHSCFKLLLLDIHPLLHPVFRSHCPYDPLWWIDSSLLSALTVLNHAHKQTHEAWVIFPLIAVYCHDLLPFYMKVLGTSLVSVAKVLEGIGIQTVSRIGFSSNEGSRWVAAEKYSKGKNQVKFKYQMAQKLNCGRFDGINKGFMTVLLRVWTGFDIMINDVNAKLYSGSSHLNMVFYWLQGFFVGN